MGILMETGAFSDMIEATSFRDDHKMLLNWNPLNGFRNFAAKRILAPAVVLAVLSAGADKQ
jgi:hypothetical protein